ncbi:MAG: HPr family phosphocarrier protein [bacterium]
MKYNKKVKIINKKGFHLRAATVFVKEAEKFRSVIKVKLADIEADGKSTLGVLTLGAFLDEEIEIIAEGVDAKEAVGALVKCVQNRFGEAD